MTPASYIGVLVSVLAAQLLIQPPAKVPVRDAEDGTDTWASVTYTGNQDGIVGSWFQPGPALTVANPGEQIRRQRFLSLCVSLLSFCCSAEM